MKTRFIVSLLSFAMIAPATGLLVGCDKEVSHDKVETKNSNGTSAKTETTVKEKPDGSVEKTTEKKVDNTPNR